MKLRENSIAPRPLISAQLSQRESADGAGSAGNFFQTGFNRVIARGLKRVRSFLGNCSRTERDWRW